jgi:hypothetical protein
MIATTYKPDRVFLSPASRRLTILLDSLAKSIARTLRHRQEWRPKDVEMNSRLGHPLEGTDIDVERRQITPSPDFGT